MGANLRTVVALLVSVLFGCSTAQGPAQEPGQVKIALEQVVSGLERPLSLTAPVTSGA